MDLNKLPLNTKIILMWEIAIGVAEDIESIMDIQVLTKEQIGELGLRQAINAGEGKTDLRVRFDKFKCVIEIIDELIDSLEAHVKNVKV